MTEQHECVWEYAWVDSPEHHRFVCRCGEFLEDDEVERRLNAIESLKRHPIMRHVMILFPSIANILETSKEEGELLGVRISSDCARCGKTFQINKEPGIVDYKCPDCGLNNKETSK